MTVLGTDRPGTIAEVTSAIARYGANIEDSAMTLLGGHVAMMMLVSGTVPPSSAFPGLVVTTTEIGSRREPRRGADEDPAADSRPAGPAGLCYVLTLHGPDRPGIISAVAGVLAAAGGEITGMTGRLCGTLYVLIADVRLRAEVDVAGLMRDLAETGAGLGSGITFRPADPDVL
ncbi:hypothetical protein GCM10010517_20450 [Streptosporangium fragile]|uniref:ACT domain-containing protein n=1 Tax=Streptosporangium fragile TaxID=46186 RepID=A0ABN3VV68_9ACTN